MGSILALIAKRLGLGLVTLFVVSIIIFAAIEALPGNFAQEILGQGATPEAIAAIERDLGLDKGPVERYFGWLGGVLVGDFGVPFAQLSFAGNFGTADRDIITVADQIRPRFQNTLFLAGFAAAGAMIGAGAIYYLALLPAAAHFAWQIRRLDIHDPQNCLAVFKSNRNAGLLLLLAPICDAGTAFL